VLVGGSVAAAVVAMVMGLVIFICVRRQWSHSVERRLRLRAQLSGLAADNDDDEVLPKDVLFSALDWQRIGHAVAHC